MHNDSAFRASHLVCGPYFPCVLPCASVVYLGDVVLDLGCGDGRFLRTLVQKTGCRGMGVEKSTELYELALQTCADEVHLSDIRYKRI